MATLPIHPFMVERGVFISPYPAPHIVPFPDPPVAARYLRPTMLMQFPEIPLESTATAGFMASCPSPGELFDVVRQWGSLRQVSVWADNSGDTPADGPANSKWGARVEFWFENEARRFEVGFGQTGSIIKGWQL